MTTDSIELTDAGRRAAESRKETSLVARIALGYGDDQWPEGHVHTAINAMNVEGEKRLVVFDSDWDEPIEYFFDDPIQARIGAAYLSVFKGPWGLKAGEEDALAAVLEEVAPFRYPNEDRNNHPIRTDPKLIALTEALYEESCKGGDIVDLTRWLTPRLIDVMEQEGR